MLSQVRPVIYQRAVHQSVQVLTHVQTTCFNRQNVRQGVAEDSISTPRWRTQSGSLKDLQAEDISPTNFEQEQALIARLLAALPDEQSEVIRLHLHGECTFAEIAEILEIPIPTAKSRYRYGIEHLRKELQKQNLF